MRKTYTFQGDPYIPQSLLKVAPTRCETEPSRIAVLDPLPIHLADVFAQWILSEFEYKNQTVMMAPASGFYSTPGLGKQEVRIAYVLKKADLVLAMETLAEALKVYPRRTI